MAGAAAASAQVRRARGVGSGGGRAAPRGAAAGARPAISVLIWSRVSGPRRYDSANRDSNTTGADSCTLFIRKTRLPSPASVCSILRAVERPGGGGALEAVEQPLLVAVGLQAPDQPGAGVREALVVEVDRVLRGQHDAEPEGARLLEQRQQRRFDGGLATGGKKPKISSM